MLKRINLINLGFDPWSEYWKRNQTITYMLAGKKYFNKILFLNSEVWLIDILRNPKHALSASEIKKWQTVFPQKVNSKIVAFTPVCLPASKRNKYSNYLSLKLKKMVINNYTNIPYMLLINDPQADQDIVDELINNSKLTVFDWSDDFVEFSSNQFEREICNNKCIKYCSKSDVVLTVNDNLKKRANKLNSNVYTVKNATNFFQFEKCTKSKEILKNIKKMGDTVVGYIGWLNSLRLDLDLLSYIIRKRPEFQFLFMGPKSEPTPLGSKIPNSRNVHILPAVPYSQYPSYLSSLDICILPNKVNRYTDGNDPIKIYDYLASGKPIVSTMTAGIENFKNLLYCAEDKHQFLEMIDQACRDESPDARINRIEAARKNSWESRFQEISDIMKPYFDKMFLE